MNEKPDTESTERIDHLILRFLEGNADSKEITELETFVGASSSNREYFNKTRNLWDASLKLPVSSESALKTVLGKIEYIPFRTRLLHSWQKVAAILIIPLILSTIWFVYDMSHKPDNRIIGNKSVTAAFGTIATIDLPDGTRVWLNSGSSIGYPETFAHKERTVNLTGEAYFEVRSDVNHPFYVNADGLIVKATGTKFSVMSYKNSMTKCVALAEGKLAVKTLDKKHREQFIQLKPLQSLKFDQSNGDITVASDDIYKYYAWKDGKMVFRNDPLSEVANRISLQYNVDVEINGEQIKTYRYYATFQNESLREVFDLLKISSPFEYKIVNQKIQSDGTFTRKKVILLPINRKTNQ